MEKKDGEPPALAKPLPELSAVDPPYEEWKDVVFPIDFLLLAAKECEFLSCYPLLQNAFQSYHYDLGAAYFGNMGETKSEAEPKLKVALMRCHEGAAGPGGALLTVKNAVAELRPKAVFCVGFAGALNHDKVKLGDVVISSKLATYAHKKVTNNGTQYRSVTTPVSRDISRLILHAGVGWKAPLKNPEVRDVKVLCDDVFLSGPELVDSEERRKKLLYDHPQAVAVEMEGEGVFAAAYDLKMEWVVIKGISDKADGTKTASKEWRPFASAMAASLVKHFLRRPSVFRKWSHYKSTTPADEDWPKEVKVGSPGVEELERLARDIVECWKELGRRLGFSEPKLFTFHKEDEKVDQKAYKMLLFWKESKDSDATYKVLYKALCDELVSKKGLGTKYCCN